MLRIVKKLVGVAASQGVLNLAEEKRLRAVKTGAGWIYDPNSVEEFGRTQRNRYILRGEEQ
jgi:hypothetical protein